MRAYRLNKLAYLKLKDRVKQKYDYKCFACGVKESVNNKLEVHHVKPRYFGGGDFEGNLVPLCKKCHERVHEKIDEYIRFVVSGLSNDVFWTILREVRKERMYSKTVSNGKWHKFKDLLEDGE